MERRKEKPTLLQIENTLQLGINRTNDALTPLGQVSDAKKRMILENLVIELSQELQGAAHDLGLKHPMIVTTINVPIEDVCKDCSYEPDACVSCPSLGAKLAKEAPLFHYSGATEASAEEDGPEQSRLEERINYG